MKEGWCFLPGVDITLQIVPVVGQRSDQSASPPFSLSKFPESMLKQEVVSELAGAQPEVGHHGPESGLLQEPCSPKDGLDEDDSQHPGALAQTHSGRNVSPGPHPQDDDLLEVEDVEDADHRLAHLLHAGVEGRGGTVRSPGLLAGEGNVEEEAGGGEGDQARQGEELLEGEVGAPEVVEGQDHTLTNTLALGQTALHNIRDWHNSYKYVGGSQGSGRSPFKNVNLSIDLFINYLTQCHHAIIRARLAGLCN